MTSDNQHTATLDGPAWWFKVMVIIAVATFWVVHTHV